MLHTHVRYFSTIIYIVIMLLCCLVALYLLNLDIIMFFLATIKATIFLNVAFFILLFGLIRLFFQIMVVSFEFQLLHDIYN